MGLPCPVRVPHAFHTPPLISSSRQHNEVSIAINPTLRRWKLRLGEVMPPALSDQWRWSQGLNLAFWLLAHPYGSLCCWVCLGQAVGATGQAPECWSFLQVPPWSACPPGSMATCTSPWLSPALCTAPSPSGYSCGGKEPSWARRGTFSEWLMAGLCPQPQGSWGPDALEGSEGSMWQKRDLGLGYTVFQGSPAWAPPSVLPAMTRDREGWSPIGSHHCWVSTREGAVGLP